MAKAKAPGSTEQRYSNAAIKRMLVNPYTTGSMVEKYTFLKDCVPPETYGVDLDLLFKLIAWVYDPESPMAKEYSSLDMRITAAAQDVGIKEIRLVEYRGVAINFIRCINSSIWAEICTNDHLFWDYVLHLSTPFSAAALTMASEDILKAVERQGKMADLMAKFRERSASLRKLMYAGDDELVAADENWTPEGVNRAMRTNKSVSNETE